MARRLSHIVVVAAALIAMLLLCTHALRRVAVMQSACTLQDWDLCHHRHWSSDGPKCAATPYALLDDLYNRVVQTWFFIWGTVAGIG